MPIPDFDIHGCLPPFLGDDPATHGRSPYRASAEELVATFGTTVQRLLLLFGWFKFRRDLRRAGFTTGYQWLCGSFVEEKEPNDIDVVTFAEIPTGIDARHPEHGHLFSVKETKARFGCDAYWVPLNQWDVRSRLKQTTYWHGLFSHQRDSLAYKGIVRVDLDEPTDAGVRALAHRLSELCPDDDE